MPKVVGVRFREGGKSYDFDTGHFVLEAGQRVIVETDRGLALGTVASPPRRITDEDAQKRKLKSIFRVADQDDLVDVGGLHVGVFECLFAGTDGAFE